MVFEKAQKADSIKSRIDFRTKRFLNKSPDYYMDPLLLFAYYQLIINHSPGDCTKLYEKYHFLAQQKYNKYLKADRLCQQNVYQENSAFFVLSGQKSDFGRIVYCNKAVKKVFGAEVKRYLDSKIYHAIFLPSLSQTFENYFKSLAETGVCPIYNQILRTFICNKEGYIKEVDFYLNTHPSITQGYYMMLTLRPPLTKKDFIILRENGEIEGASKKICQRLGILMTADPQKATSAQKYHISKISRELAKANESINMLKRYENWDYTKTLPNIDLKESRDLALLYQEQGNEIILKSIRKAGENYQDQFHYYCKISSLNYGSVSLRMLHLDEIKNDHETDIFDLIEENHIYDIPEAKREYGDEKSKTTISGEKNNSIEIIEEEEYGAGEEKENGWIDFGTLGTTVRQHPQTTKEKSSSSRGLIEYMSSSVRNSQAKIILPEPEEDCEKLTKNKANKFATKFIRKATVSPDLPDFKRIMEHESMSSDAQSLHKKNKNLYKNIIVAGKIAESAKNSTTSRQSSRKRMIEGFKLAIKTNYYSRMFKFGVVGYALITVLILLSILYLFFNLRSITDDLIMKKNIMINAQTRALNLAALQTTMRTQYDLVMGGLKQSEMGLVAKPASSYTSINNGYVMPILSTNQKLLEMAGELDGISREPFFDKDVRIFYPEGFVNLTSFQATEIIIQTLLDIVALFKATQNVSVTLSNFTNVNVLNDVALKNDQISNVTMVSAQTQVDSIQSVVTNYFIFVCLLTVALICVLGGLVILQHLRNKKNLLQMCKLNTRGVQFVLENQKNFKNILNANLELNEAKFFNITESFKSSSLSSMIMTEKAKRKETLVISNYSGIQRTFNFQIVRAIILPIVLVLPLILTTLFASESMSYFNTKLSQISFATQIGTKVTRAMSASVELPTSNDTMIIEDIKASQAAEKSIAEINHIRNKLFDSFSDEDTLANPRVHGVLLGNGCKILGTTDALYCNTLAAYAVNTSLVQVLWSYQNVLNDRFQNYSNSDRSTTALRKNRVLHLDTMISMRRVIANEGLVILTALNYTFGNKTVEFNKQRYVSFHCSWSIFLVLGILICIFVLYPVKQSDFKFKKVLQIFPAQLILSNFSLKLFLLETSPFGMIFISDQ